MNTIELYNFQELLTIIFSLVTEITLCGWKACMCDRGLGDRQVRNFNPDALPVWFIHNYIKTNIGLND